MVSGTFSNYHTPVVGMKQEKDLPVVGRGCEIGPRRGTDSIAVEGRVLLTAWMPG